MKYLIVLGLVIAGLCLGTYKAKAENMNDAQLGKVKIFESTTGKYILVDRVIKSDEEWKKILTAQQFAVMRGQGTERAFCQLPMNKEHRKGVYKCAGCGTDLFHFDKKFESHTGWPSFWQPIDPANVGEKEDNSYGMHRVEVYCVRCLAHLGHVFEDGPPPSGKRYCINQVALVFVPDKNN